MNKVRQYKEKYIYQKNPKKNSHIQKSDKVTEQLERIMISPEFHATASQRKLLDFIISKTNSGSSDELKGYTIAVEVFQRGVEFDPNSNPIVSIQAGKLRQALERYYLVAGQNDPLRIDIPKGSYIPIFIDQTSDELDSTVTDKTSDEVFKDRSPVIEIAPFNNLTGDSTNDIIGMGFASELAIEISHYQEVKIVHTPNKVENPDQKGKYRFILYGNVYKNNTEIKVSFQLMDTKTGEHIWGEKYRMDIGSKKLLKFQEKVAQKIAHNLFDSYGVISTKLFNESKLKPLSDLTAYEAILKFYEFEKTWTKDTFLIAMEALNHAKINEPNCGQVWTLLGNLYANIYGMDFSGFKDPIEKALQHAEKGISIMPSDHRAWGILAYIYLLSDELSLAREAINRALKLNAGSPLNREIAGYVMTLLGEWEKGPTLIKKCIELSPNYRTSVHYALWLNRIRQKNYEEAYMEIINFPSPNIFWYPLAKASTLGLLGEHKKGEAFVNRLIELKPDFSSKAVILVRRYVKFEGLVDRILKGLNEVGMDID